MQNELVETEFTRSLDSLRDHPFIVSAMRGELTREQSLRWVMCAGRESRSFPFILTQLLEWEADERIRAILQENLDDELGGGDPDHAHFKHYLHLLANLGIDRTQFDEYEESAGIQFALSLAFNIADSRQAPEAIGYMLLNEAMTPITYEAARSALTRHFPDLKTNFFDLHIEVDAEHVQGLQEAVGVLPDAAAPGLRFGFALAKRGMEVLLDEAYGILDYHPGAINIIGVKYDTPSAVAN